MGDRINYGRLMHQAMRGLIRELLKEVERNGLPGDHHFFITFDTRVPGVEIADWLRERYPEEMTVVMQHWFDNLAVEEDRFSVTLNFGNQPEPLVIPFRAITTFVDPSVEFGLRFELEEAEEVPESPMIEIGEDEEDEFSGEQEPRKPRGEAEVVSLDKFRKH